MNERIYRKNQTRSIEAYNYRAELCCRRAGAVTAARATREAQTGARPQRLWSLVHYSAIVSLDVDVSLLRSVDHLFAPRCGQPHAPPYRPCNPTPHTPPPPRLYTLHSALCTLDI